MVSATEHAVNFPLKLALAAAVAMIVVGIFLPRQFPLDVSEPSRASTATSEAAQPPLPRPTAGLGNTTTLEADPAGHFHADVEIEGRIIAMIVDTGASFVALSAEDAARIGLRPFESDYKVTLQTANGPTTAAQVRLRDMRVGSVVGRDVPAVILRPGLLGQSLLGMTFLKTLGRVEIGDRRLVLRQ